MEESTTTKTLQSILCQDKIPWTQSCPTGFHEYTEDDGTTVNCYKIATPNLTQVPIV